MGRIAGGKSLSPATGAARWAPSSGIFAPTTGLDHRLFDGRGRLRDPVRHDLMTRLDQCLRVDSGLTGSDWQDWMKVYLAGGSASEWAGSRPNDQAQDLDVLVGVDYAAARGHSHFPGMTDEQIDSALNAAFRACFNNPDWHPDFGGTWSLTAYVNPQAYDIHAIKPYAAYDVSDMAWGVKPPHLPEHTLADFDPAVLAEARAIASEARAILKLPEPLRTREATALWERLHAERRQAFSIEGEGWTDPGNVAEKWLAYAPGDLLGRIRELALAPKTAAAEHVPEGEPIVRDRNDLGWGSDEWADARRDPWHKASQLAQREVRQAHPKLTMEFPRGEEGDRMVGHLLGYAGYKGPTEGAFAARHPDPSKMGSNPAWLNGKPGVALHPDRWDYGTVAHEAAHHAVMYDHAIAPNTPQTDEQVHGPEWAGHYAQALNRISKHAGDDFLYHHGRFRDMITDGLKYRRPSDLDAAEKHLPPSHWAEDHIYDPPTRLAAALELKGAAATHVGTPDHITYEHDKYGDGEHWFSAQHPEAGEVGHAHVFERSGPSGPHVEIKTLETNPHFRGRGVGTQLLGNVEKHFPGRELRLKPYPIDEDGDQTTEDLEDYYEGRGFEHRPLQEGDDLDLYDWMHKQASGWDEPCDDSDEDDLAGNAYGVYPDQDYYHGTAAALKPGDLITSPAERGTGHSRNVWFTSRRGTAGHYAIQDANDRTPGHPGHVYHVMPHASESEFDEAKYEGEYSTRKPLEVIGEEPFEHWRHEVYGRPVHQHPDGTWHPDPDPQPHQALKGYEGLTGRTAMIYLDLPPDAVRRLDGGVDDHHITVVYLGKNVSDDAFAEACRRAEQAAGKVRPLSGILRGVDTFPPSDSSDDKTPVFVPAYVPGIGHLRRLLEDLSASEHRNYRPHVTLAYLEPGDDLPAPHPKVEVRFSHLHVKRGDQVVSFPLGQSK